MLLKALYSNGLTLSIQNSNKFELDSSMYLYMNTMRDIISDISIKTNGLISLVKFAISEEIGVSVRYSPTKRFTIVIVIDNLKEISSMVKIDIDLINKYFTNIIDTLFSIVSQNKCNDIIPDDMEDDEYTLKIENTIREMDNTSFIMAMTLFGMILNFNKAIISSNELLNQKLKK